MLVIRAFGVHPLRVQIGQHGLVANVFEALGRLSVHQTATTPSPSLSLLRIHPLLRGLHTQGRGRVDRVGERQSAGMQKCGRQLGGVGRSLGGTATQRSEYRCRICWRLLTAPGKSLGDGALCPAEDVEAGLKRVRGHFVGGVGV